MAEQDRQALLQDEYHKQTAIIHWHDLQTHYAAGDVVRVDTSLDLVNVAVQLGMDNTGQFQQWIDGELIAPVTKAEALAWYDTNQTFWAVVSAPWVLVQLRNSE